jgi:hypothetical protein
MESPLSFNSSENFRKKLLVRNLKPYKVDGSFSSDYKPADSEFNLFDFSVINSPDVEVIGNNQEKILYTKNKYGPLDQNNTYGDVVNINVNLNNDTNFGEYGFQDAIGSNLENIGNSQENFLYVKNLYGPTQFGTSYGDTVTINTTLLNNTNLGQYGYPLTVNSKLEQIGNTKEGDLIVKNVYKPNNINNFGDTVWYINNDLTIATNGEGEYSILDTDNSFLSQIGNSQEVFLRVKNKYSPESGNDYGNTRYSINNDLILGSNEGEYNFWDTFGNQLETLGREEKDRLLIKNEYGPEGSQSQSEVTPFTLIPKPIQQVGNYDYGDTINSDLVKESNKDRPLLIAVNQYGPAQPRKDTVNINQNLQTNANEGEYGFPDTVESNLEQIGFESLDQLIVNSYRPETENLNIVDPNSNLPKKPNKGIYDVNDTINSELEIVGNSKEEQAYGKNKYVTGTGTYEPLTIDDLQIKTIGTPYANGLKTLGFIPSTYSPINILNSDNPKGSDGSLSQDSDLANIGARQLQKEFKNRIALELLSQTLGRVNALTSSINPDSGEISVKPNLDPFNAVGIISGNIPVLERNYRITAVGGSVGDVVSFASRLAGLYSPVSLIPGEYFDYPERKTLNPIIENPFKPLIDTALTGIRTLLNPNNSVSSDLFINNTTEATKSLIYEQLFYNEYRPDYRLNTVTNPNLFSPAPNFYVGTRKNTITELVSPISEQAKDKNGDPNGGPVLSYSNIGKEYEGKKITDLYTGFNSRPYFDGISGVQGGLTWMSEKNYVSKYQFVGPEGKTVNTLGQSLGQDKSFFESRSFGGQFDATQSFNNEFTKGSLLDVTQKLVDAGNRSSYKLEHVGNAINQLSKVFNDGYVELTKGSRVVKYTTKTSNPASPEGKDVVGYEYCRLFTKDRPYMTYDELQKTDGNIRKFTNSVLDNTFNLNIAPFKGNESTNVQNGKVKKYMLSIENLAWRTSNRPGYTYEDLPECERGPNGGRIMWFPPYELTFSESISPQWTDHNFLGRTEPIYTYSNTSRKGDLSFKIIVDNPSITNLLVEKELQNLSNNSEISKVMDSFFAGCLKYDIYDLAKRYRQFTLKDIFDTVSYLDDEEIEKLIVVEPDVNVDEEVVVEDVPILSATTASTATTATTAVTEYNFIEPIFYFHNDRPDKASTKETSTISFEVSFEDYKDLRERYLDLARDRIIKYNDTTYKDYTTQVVNDPNFNTQKWLENYIDCRKNSVNEFFDYAEKEFQQVKDFLTEVMKVLKSGGEVTFSIRGSASAVTTDSYNEKLSKRRIDSVKQFIFKFEYDGEKIEKYIKNKKLTIKEFPKGESEIIQDPKYKNVKCTNEFLNDNSEGTISVNAMACRRVRIFDIQVKQENKPVEEKKPDPPVEQKKTEIESVIAQKNEDEEKIEPQFVKVIEKQKVQRKRGVPRKDLTKRLLRKLLTECNYFELVKQSDPMIYDGIKEKIKHFHPAFHSMTPEGLNARLVFIQQIARPGDTIPTVSETDGANPQLVYNDVTNSVFGAPPVCVLRIGDFWHTKVVFDTISISYDEDTLDLNPEGIGVQPMIATIKLGFNFIGAHGMAEPIAKLQNALSFNYYANTEMYDERAEATEDVTSKYDAEILASIKDELGIVENFNRPPTNDGGVTIGTLTSNFFDPDTGQINGDINYKDIMKDLVEKTKNYANTINNSLKDVYNKNLFGGLSILNAERKYSKGYFDYLSGDTSNETTIFGKSQNIQTKVDLLFEKINKDIEDELIPILANVQLENFKKNEIRKIKNKLKQMAQELKSGYLSNIENANNTIVKDELPLIKLIDQLNYVTNSTDGYINKMGTVVVYGISGTSKVDVSSVGVSDTFQELKQDFLKIYSGLTQLNNNLAIDILNDGTAYKYNDNFDYDVYLTTDPTQIDSVENRCFMVFGKSILDNPTKFISTLVEPVQNTTDDIKWNTFISKNIGWSFDLNLTTGQFTNQPTPNGLYSEYKKSKETTDNIFKFFEDNFFKNTFTNYIPYNLEKQRNFKYSKILTPTDIDQNNLKDIYSIKNSVWDKFNLKKSFT